MNGSKQLPFGIDISPLSLARMLWKRKLSLLVVWVAVTVVTVAVVRQLPAVYKASALIILDAQKIPERYVSATVNTDVYERFSTISQQILSSSQLKKIIDQFHLYESERQKRFPEEIVEMMRNNIEITAERAVAGGRNAAFRVAFQGPDPAVVAQVANQIANLYVLEGFKTREVQAEGTAEFIEAQLNEAKQQLDELEGSVSSYKVTHNGELPQQEGSLNAVLGRLGIQLEANRDAINRAQSSKALLESSLKSVEEMAMARAAAMKAAPRAGAPAVVADAEGNPAPAPKRRSETLRAQLEALRLRYSEEHPDLQRLRQQLALTERQEELEIASAPPPQPKRAAAPPVAAPVEVRTDPIQREAQERISSLRSQIALAQQELDNRKVEQSRILADMSSYQSRLGRLPVREQEMAQITRDYEIAKRNYQSLLDKKISANMAADMEKRQKAERFTIADPAKVPGRPFRPNRPVLCAAGSVFGLILGLVLALAREVPKGLLLGEWQLPAGVVVLGRLPYIQHESVIAEANDPPEGGGGRWLKNKAALLSSVAVSAVLILAGIVIARRVF